jgi:5S rRNA maturation endonuclease (ribonuclease M5)
MEKFGIKVTRGYIKRLVKEICDAAGVTRESIGIFAGVRAELYFNGSWTSVSFDSVKNLADKGTDIIFIEKEGIPEVLSNWANKYGIAMVNTRGHLTEYGKDLMKAAKQSGAHVVIMTDYDATGVKIASESPTDMPWIGCNDKMLEYFQLDRDSVKVESETNANIDYIKSLVQKGIHRDGRKDARFKDVDIEFLKKDRVELDAVLAKVGDERFFGYIIKTLQELYPKRDYNRALKLPVDSLHATHDYIIEEIKERVYYVISSEANKIRKELSETLGFIDVNEKSKEIEDRLRNALYQNPHYHNFADKLKTLVEEHPFLAEAKGESSR